MSDQAIVGSTNFMELARCLFEESSDALIIFDPQDLKVLDVNPLAQRLTQRTPKELKILTLTDLFLSDTPSVFDEFLSSCQNTRIYHSKESHQLIRREGERLDVNLSVSRLHTSPTPLGLISVRDISIRKSLEADLRRTQAALELALDEKTSRLEAINNELRRNEQRMRELLDDVDAIVWEASLPCLQLTFVSKQAEKILGYPVSRWIEEHDFWFNHLHSSEATRCLQELRNASEKGQDHSLQYRMISAEGREIWLRDVIHVVKDPQGTPVKLRGVMIDVTPQVVAEKEKIRLNGQLRKNERQLAHVARLSTMGEMVAGISHEINQPLSAIANFANASLQILQQRRELSDDPLTQWMQQISDQAIRCGDIIRRLRGFARRSDTEEITLNVYQAIHDSKEIISDLLHEHAIAFEINVDHDPWVQINAAEFQQVLVNLLRNACEAVVESSASQPTILIHATTFDDTMRLTVQDNGPGVDADVADSIFDPFVTTRNDGMGMGLGISRSIIRNHRGDLFLDRDYTQGARFCVELPLADVVSNPENTPGTTAP